MSKIVSSDVYTEAVWKGDIGYKPVVVLYSTLPATITVVTEWFYRLHGLQCNTALGSVSNNAPLYNVHIVQFVHGQHKCDSVINVKITSTHESLSNAY